MNESAPKVPFASMCGRVTRSPSTARQTACGKAIIVGEHAVVYGAAAVAVPLQSLRIHIELKPLNSQNKNLIRMTLGNKAASPALTRTVADVFELLGVEPFPMEIEGNSEVFIGAGLGSSAALCIVLLRAISESLGMRLTNDELAYLGNKLEGRFHGTPSGLDTAAVAHEQPLIFRKGVPPRFLKNAGMWEFVLIDSGIRASTKTMVETARPWFTGPAGDSRIEGFDQATRQAAKALETMDHISLADAMNRSGAWLAETGIVTPALQEIIDICRNNGAIAAKTTGAGGGGCVLALMNSAGLSQINLAHLEHALANGNCKPTVSAFQVASNARQSP